MLWVEIFEIYVGVESVSMSALPRDSLALTVASVLKIILDELYLRLLLSSIEQ